jgi:hypothetical protein
VQRLALPKGVKVLHAVPAVGHLSSSSIYPACLTPYVMVTACSDNTLKFLQFILVPAELLATVGGGSTSCFPGDNFEWQEWKMESTSGISEIELPGVPVSVCAAFSTARSAGRKWLVYYILFHFSQVQLPLFFRRFFGQRNPRRLCPPKCFSLSLSRRERGERRHGESLRYLGESRSSTLFLLSDTSPPRPSTWRVLRPTSWSLLAQITLVNCN